MKKAKNFLSTSQNRQRIAIYSLIAFSIINALAIILITKATRNPSSQKISEINVNASQDGIVADTIHSGFPIKLDSGTKNGSYYPSSPVLADLDGEGKKSIIVYGREGLGGLNGSNLQLNIINHDGAHRPGWPKNLTTGIKTHGSQAFVGNFGSEATPAVGDIDGDSIPEIIAVSYTHQESDDKLTGYLHAFKPNGNEAKGWPITIPNSGLYNQAIGQVVPGGNPEVIIATRNVITREKFIYAFSGGGNIINGFPYSIGTDSDKVGQQYYPLVSLADLDKDGAMEILTYQGTNIMAFSASKKKNPTWSTKLSNVSPFVKIVSGDVNNDSFPEIFITQKTNKAIIVKGYTNKGVKLYGWDKRIRYKGGAGPAGVSLADLDGDKTPEVLMGFCNTCNQIYAWKGDGSNLSGWPVRFSQANTSFTELLSLDVDNSGQQTIIVPGWGRDPDVIAIHASGQVIPDWPHFPQDQHLYPWYITPAVGDLDGNGTLEFIASSSDGDLYAWDLPAKSTNRVEWSMFGNSPTLDGTYKPPSK